MFDPRIESKHLGGACVISISGEIDMYTAPRLEQELLGAFGTGVTTVVVDLTECELIDARALSILAWAGRQLESAAGWLALVTDHRRIRSAFEITGLDAMLEIYPSRARPASTNGASGDPLAATAVSEHAPAATASTHDARRPTIRRQQPSRDVVETSVCARPLT
jgi:anti-sigma B factor antagonist